MSSGPISRATRAPKPGRSMALAILAIVGLSMTFGIAQAGSRNVGIGVGTGLQILNELSKAGTTKKRSAKKKTYKAQEKKSPSKTAKRPRDDEESAPKSASKGDDDAAGQESTEAQGETAPAPQPAATTPAATAATAATAAAATGALPDPAAAAPSVISTPQEISSTQEHLRYLGYNVPSPAGVLDVDTKIAIMKFQDSIKAEPTGVITAAQLRRLYTLADEKQKQAK